MPPEAALKNVKNTNVYWAMDTQAARLFGTPEIIQKPDFSKNQISAPPEFLFFRRITIFRLRVLISLRRGTFLSAAIGIGPPRQPATARTGPSLRQELFDMRFV